MTTDTAQQPAQNNGAHADDRVDDSAQGADADAEFQAALREYEAQGSKDTRGDAAGEGGDADRDDHEETGSADDAGDDNSDDDNLDDGEADAADAMPEWAQSLVTEIRAEKQARERFEHQMRSDIGRLRSKRGGDAKSGSPAGQVRDAVDAATHMGASKQDRENALAKLKALGEDFPEIADAVTDAINGIVTPLESQISDLMAAQQDSDTERAQRAREQASDLVRASHQDFEEIIRSPEWAAWLQQQPPGIQSLALASTDPRDAIRILDDFKATLSQSAAHNGAAGAHNSQTQNRQSAASDQARREQRLKANTPMSGRLRTPHSTAGLPPADDFEGSLRYFDRLEKEGRLT